MSMSPFTPMPNHQISPNRSRCSTTTTTACRAWDSETAIPTDNPFMNVFVGLDKTAKPKGERNFKGRRLVGSWTVEPCRLHALECSPRPRKKPGSFPPGLKMVLIVEDLT